MCRLPLMQMQVVKKMFLTGKILFEKENFHIDCVVVSTGIIIRSVEYRPHSDHWPECFIF